MIRGLVTLGVLILVALCPWQFSAAIALLAAVYEPWTPLAAGVFADVIYWSPSASTIPHMTLWGAAATAVVLFVHTRIKASIISS